MNSDLMFSSKTDNWETPSEFFTLYDSIFHFDLDVCASESNHKCEKYFTKEQDGLNQKWFGNCWMNPPYGREIGKWVKKAYESVMGGTYLVRFAYFLHEQILLGGMSSA